MFAAWLGVALAGDVWVTVQARDRNGSVAIDLPAAVIPDDARPVLTARISRVGRRP